MPPRAPKRHSELDPLAAIMHTEERKLTLGGNLRKSLSAGGSSLSATGREFNDSLCVGSKTSCAGLVLQLATKYECLSILQVQCFAGWLSG